MIASTPTSASEPGIGPSSILIISPSDLPSRRTDANSTMKSCTAPATTTPARIHSVPGRIAHLRREHRAHQRARAGDRREVVAVEHPLVGRHVVHAVVVPHGGRRPRVVEPEHLLGDELAVEAIRDEIDAERRGHQPDRVDALAATERECREGERARRRPPLKRAAGTRACCSWHSSAGSRKPCILRGQHGGRNGMPLRATEWPRSRAEAAPPFAGGRLDWPGLAFSRRLIGVVHLRCCSRRRRCCRLACAERRRLF